jgi:hypothetical protein
MANRHNAKILLIQESGCDTDQVISHRLPITGSSTGQIMWDLWWTKRHWDKLSPSASVSIAYSYSTDCSTLIIIIIIIIIIIHLPGLVKKPNNGRRTKWIQCSTHERKKKVHRTIYSHISSEIRTHDTNVQAVHSLSPHVQCVRLFINARTLIRTKDPSVPMTYDHPSIVDLTVIAFQPDMKAKLITIQRPLIIHEP